MTNCSSGIHDRPTPGVPEGNAQSKDPSGSSGSSPPPSPIETWKIEERYGVYFGTRDSTHPGTLLGKKMDSLSLLLGRRLAEVEES